MVRERSEGVRGWEQVPGPDSAGWEESTLDSVRQLTDLLGTETALSPREAEGSQESRGHSEATKVLRGTKNTVQLRAWPYQTSLRSEGAPAGVTHRPGATMVS